MIPERIKSMLRDVVGLKSVEVYAPGPDQPVRVTVEFHWVLDTIFMGLRKRLIREIAGFLRENLGVDVEIIWRKAKKSRAR